MESSSVDEIGYTIISINDSRLEKKQAIANILDGSMQKYSVLCVDGKNKNQVAGWMHSAPRIDPVFTALRGEIGVWLSQINAWRKILRLNRPLLILEDDAILSEDFVSRFREMMLETPETYDFISVFVPNNQEPDYYMEWAGYDAEGKPSPFGIGAPQGAPMFQIGSEVMVKTYQGYSLVATVISPKGAQRLLDLAYEKGMYTPVDCFFFLNRNLGLLEGYAPQPKYPRAVSIDWKADTLIHDTGHMV